MPPETNNIKHQNDFPFEHLKELPSNKRHRLFSAQKNGQKHSGKNYFWKLRDINLEPNNQLISISAISSELFRYLLGAKGASKERVLTDDNGEAIGFISREISGFTPAFQAFQEGKFQIEKIKTEKKAELANLLMSLFLLEEGDPAGNWGFDKEDNIVKIDHEDALKNFRIKYLEYGEVADELAEDIGTLTSHPNLRYYHTTTISNPHAEINLLNLENFPETQVENPMLLHFPWMADLKSDEDFIYETYLCAIKAILLDDKALEAMINDHLIKEENKNIELEAKKYLLEKFKKLKKELQKSTKFQNSIKENKEKFKNDLKNYYNEYNDIFKKESKSHRRINIKNYLEKFDKLYIETENLKITKIELEKSYENLFLCQKKSEDKASNFLDRLYKVYLSDLIKYKNNLYNLSSIKKTDGVIKYIEKINQSIYSLERFLEKLKIIIEKTNYNKKIAHLNYYKFHTLSGTCLSLKNEVEINEAIKLIDKFFLIIHTKPNTNIVISQKQIDFLKNNKMGFQEIAKSILGNSFIEQLSSFKGDCFSITRSEDGKLRMHKRLPKGYNRRLFDHIDDLSGPRTEKSDYPYQLEPENKQSGFSHGIC